ncbi:MAG: preprotein translocase subunit SecE [Limnochordales bacterium]|nr:preprotein translocase subunit SecE [Limnochordales bacterium]
MATAANRPAKAGQKFVDKAGRFFREVKAELRKVTWPNRKELTTYTAVVITLSLIVALFLGVIDLGLSAIFSALSGLGG